MGVLGVGADAAVVDVVVRYAEGQQLEAVGQGKVDVVLLLPGVPLGYLLHGEVGLLEGLVYLDADLEGGKRDAGAYDGVHIGAAGSIGFVHGLQGVCYDVAYRAAPSGMDGCHDAVGGIVEEDGYAIGRRHAQAGVLEGGDEGVLLLQQGVAGISGEAVEGLVDDEYVAAVRLIGYDEVLGTDVDEAAQLVLVGAHDGWLVARVGGAVEGAVGAAAAAAMAGGAECHCLGVGHGVEV